MKKGEIEVFFGTILDRVIIVPYEQIPEIPLYMDQLTTFIDEKLKGFKRVKTDKILTKTMINNYTKDNLIPPSAKKRYDRDHAALLIIVYHLKSCLTINDISCLFDMVEAVGMTVERFYRIFTDICRQTIDNENCGALLPAGYFDEENDETRSIAAILSLAVGASTRKLLAEKLLDKVFVHPAK